MDDSRGVGEPLNETDSKGLGIKVNAHYQVFMTTGPSGAQRKTQVDADLPLQVFYSNKNFTQGNTTWNMDNLPTYDGMNWDGAKLVMFPLAKNKILVRLENLNDIYDNKTSVEHVDLLKLANYLYE